MKRLFLIVLLCSFFRNGFSQDLIVLTSGDSINCKITKLGKEFIYFAYKSIDGVKNTVQPLTNVKKYQFNFYAFSLVPADKVKWQPDYQRIRIGFRAGMSWLTDKIDKTAPTEIQNYYSSLKSGNNFGADFTYFVNNSFGVGVKYSNFFTKNTLDNWMFSNSGGSSLNGRMKDDINVNYIAPAFFTRLPSKSGMTQFVTDFSVGYAGYSNDAELIYPFKITGKTIAVNLDLGFDFKLGDHMTLGIGGGIFLADLSKVEVKSGTSVIVITDPEGESESLTRFDAFIALRWNN